MEQPTSRQPTRESSPLKTLNDPDLVKKYQETEDQEVFDEMLRRARPAIQAGIRSWGGGNPALGLRARILAAKALKRYDPEKARNASIRTWVSSNMPKLARYRDTRTAVMHVPDSVKEDTRYLTRLRDKHVEEFGEQPSMGWLKDRAGMGDKRFQKAVSAFSETSESRVHEGEAMGIGEEDSGYRMWVDAVYAGLDEPGRKIFEGVSGYRGAPVKQKQTLAKELGMSPAAVTSRLNTIQKQLAEYKVNK